MSWFLLRQDSRLANATGNQISKPQRKDTYQVTLDALKLNSCYPAFLITARVPEIYMHQFWNTVTKFKDSSSYQLKLDNKKFKVNAEKLYHSSLNSDTHEILRLYLNCSLITCINPGVHLQLSSTGAFPGKPLDLVNLGTLKYLSKTEEHQFYGALIPKEMLNEDILISTAYKTYYAYTSDAKEHKKARKFKKHAFTKQKTVLKPAKKS
ncbi:hypothetical protein Tco_1223664 [Tanacetum coccineum]